ncbi:hypothetical protein B0A55_04979 [Friedmanniomyces simplex]|uniref:Uncharacterized protein n=1 Tax=Friedmanniomyces simplex TaxID=329884 RepID=A0A4U0X642_9PEZI|nr:hypothetical protein B0A55_04979 [Friedmanniomyces simplex]
METATNPVFRPTKPIKILLSPGHGAGWPLVDGLEKKLSRDKLDDLLARFHLEAKARFGIDRIVTSRVGDLFVLEMNVPFEIRENEGQERVVDVSRLREIVLAAAAGVGGEKNGGGIGSGSGSGSGNNSSGGGGGSNSSAPPPPTSPPQPRVEQSQPAQVPTSQPEQSISRGVTVTATRRGVPKAGK